MGQKGLATFWQRFGLRKKNARLSFPELFDHFQKLIGDNNRALEIMADMGAKMGGEFIFDQHYIKSSTENISECVYRMIYHLDRMSPDKFQSLFPVFNRIREQLESEIDGNLVIPEGDNVLSYRYIDNTMGTLVGGKNGNLGVLQGLLGVKVPEGFAITTYCFHQLVNQSSTGPKIRELLRQWEEGRETVEVSGNLGRIIRGLHLPKAISKAIAREVSSIVSSSPRKTKVRFAVRSSAIGEDSEHSFAGQYESVLGVRPAGIEEAYLEVLASLYSVRAMEYRRKKSIKESEAMMAVGVQAMVDARVSGVAYTLNPLAPEKEQMLIAATFGLGAGIVGGEQVADQFHVSRKPPYEILGMDIVQKNKIIEGKSGEGGVSVNFLDPRLRGRPSLKIKEIRQLVDCCMQLENYFRHPQDIEFCFDGAELIILQSRPLNIEKSVPRLTCDFTELEANSTVLMDGLGDVVQEGVGMGVVHNVRSEEELDLTPQGAILVTHFSSPVLARVLQKVNGVITDIGSPIGHLSTIAREYRVPMLINTRNATRILESGMEITLDAKELKVYDGMMPQLCYFEFAEEPFEETYEFRLLRRLLKKISPLQLVDPAAVSFKPEACQTLHDLIRFVHEKSIEALIERNYSNDRFLRDHARKLKLDVPLDLTVIDFSDCHEDVVVEENNIDQPSSRSLQSFAEGICVDGIWENRAVAVDMKSFMSSMTRTFSTQLSDPRFIGQNLAVTSGDYMNVSLRLGYHFSMIDSICSRRELDNYVYFRFFGGVTDTTRRSRRVRLIQQILMGYDFMVSCKGDLVVGRIKGASAESLYEKIFILGALVSYTRQLDVKLVDERLIDQYTENFQAMLGKEEKQTQP